MEMKNADFGHPEPDNGSVADDWDDVTSDGIHCKHIRLKDRVFKRILCTKIHHSSRVAWLNDVESRLEDPTWIRMHLAVQKTTYALKMQRMATAIVAQGDRKLNQRVGVDRDHIAGDRERIVVEKDLVQSRQCRSNVCDSIYPPCVQRVILHKIFGKSRVLGQSTGIPPLRPIRKHISRGSC